MPVAIGIVTHRLASAGSTPGSRPTTTPPERAAPRDAAAITPPRPPHTRTAPAAAIAAPTRSARAAMRREHRPSPITPMCNAMAAARNGGLRGEVVERGGVVVQDLAARRFRQI